MRRPSRSKLVTVSSLVVLTFTLVFSHVLPVLAATYEEATWYYSTFNLANNLKVSDGSGVKIALIDVSIDPSVPELANAKIETQPSMCYLNGSNDPVNSTTDATHATQMAVVIAGNGTGTWDGRGGKGVAPGATILHYRNATSKAGGDDNSIECKNAQGADMYDQATANAIRDSTRKGARIVNMSFGGDATMPVSAEAMGEAERQGVIFVVASDDKANSRDPERLGYPAKYNGAVIVNAVAPGLKLTSYASLSNLVTILAPGQTMAVGGINPATGVWDSTGVFGGSSPAAAFISGVLADAMSHYPKATGNQIIQLMLRTTGGTYHGIPSRTSDGYGFGIVSLTAMYEHDPTKLPDVNPLLRDDAEPSTADIVGDSGSATPSKQTAQAKPAQKSHLPIILGVIIAALGAAAVIIIRRRRSVHGLGEDISPEKHKTEI